MRLATFFLALVPMAMPAQTPPAPAAPSPCSNTPAYKVCELPFELSGKDAAGHPKPYVSVELKVEFRSPRRRTYAMPAFWNGGGRMLVRFAPTEAGDWDYHVTSNIADWNDKTGSFTVAASESPGFLRPANVHHWAYTEKASTGLDQPHLWMGANAMQFASLDDAAFRSLADARAAQKFNHLRGLVLGGTAPAYSGADAPNLEYFQRLDQRVQYLNEKGIIADLVLAGGNGALTKTLPDYQQRRRFVRFVVARYAAMNITWQGLEKFEDYPDGRALIKELGLALKELDPYQHPRTSGAAVTSTPLLDDGWMTFATQGAVNDSLGSIEHQLYAVPFIGVGDSGPAAAGADAARHRLWNTTMNGQYAAIANDATDPAAARTMTAWFDFLKDTRYWELEPYFDVDGGRAVALEDVEYVVYIEKPGPLELTVEKHGYDIYWINPADGEATRGKKFSGEHFTGEPPDRSHDWVLHVVREGRVEGMNRSFKFESREIVLQEVEANTPKVPFAIEAPKGAISVSKPTPYAAKMTRESRATRSMMWLWMGEVAADQQGRRVLATSQKGDMQAPKDIAKNYPATMHLRLYGMNANGKVYELDSGLQINP